MAGRVRAALQTFAPRKIGDLTETHRVLVVVQNPIGFWYPGELAAYGGPPDWKFEPLDAKSTCRVAA
jgi:hypothetical protein